MSECPITHCNGKVETMTNKRGLLVCQRCADEMNGEGVTLGRALFPNANLKEKLRKMLDIGRLRK